jgi:hypothetical protein
MLFTPSPSRAIQSMLFALQVPVRYGPLDLSPVPPGEAGKDDEPVDPRRSGTRGGDVIRDCAVVEYVSALIIILEMMKIACPLFCRIRSSRRAHMKCWRKKWRRGCEKARLERARSRDHQRKRTRRLGKENRDSLHITYPASAIPASTNLHEFPFMQGSDYFLFVCLIPGSCR